MEEVNVRKNDIGGNTGENNSTNMSSNGNSFEYLCNLDELIERTVETNIDYGYGNIDVIWNVSLHRLLPQVKWGFIEIDSEGKGDKDSQDNQYSQRKIEEAIIRGLRSGMDRVYLIAENEDMARSISGKVEWLSSFGSLIRFDTFSLGLAPNQEKSAIIVPSQDRVPAGEKLRKEEMKEREAKFNEYNRPKGDKTKDESKREQIEREFKLNQNSRPSDQTKLE